MDKQARIALAVAGLESEDPEIRNKSMQDIEALCHEGVDDPLPYRIYIDMLTKSFPVDAWSQILHNTVLWTRLFSEGEGYEKDQKYSVAHNICMKVGLALRNNDDHEEAVSCFMMAMRFYFSIEEDRSLIEEFPESCVFLAMDSADEADDEVYGEKRREVEALWEDIRGINDDDDD